MAPWSDVHESTPCGRRQPPRIGPADSSRPRQLHQHRDLALLQHGPRTDAEHQQLRRVEGAARQNHFTRRVGLPKLAGGLIRLRVGPVQPLAFQILDADRASGFVEQHARRQRVHLDFQAIGEAPLHVEDALAGAHPGMTSSRQGRIADADGAFFVLVLIIRIAQRKVHSNARHPFSQFVASGDARFDERGPQIAVEQRPRRPGVDVSHVSRPRRIDRSCQRPRTDDGGGSRCARSAGA